MAPPFLWRQTQSADTQVTTLAVQKVSPTYIRQLESKYSRLSYLFGVGPYLPDKPLFHLDRFREFFWKLLFSSEKVPVLRNAVRHNLQGDRAGQGGKAAGMQACRQAGYAWHVEQRAMTHRIGKNSRNWKDKPLKQTKHRQDAANFISNQCFSK